MADFFEIDFLKVESKKSGDAIPIRYQLNGNTYIHVVDGGYQDTGDKIIKHINNFYNNPGYIDHIVATHPDGDHAGGLRKVIEEFTVGTLWMLRPWIYADELIDRFAKFKNVDNLKKRLREIYPYISALEELAIEKNVTINEPFQGARIGAFLVFAPTKARYLDLIVESEKTPESAKTEQLGLASTFGLMLKEQAAKVINFIKAAWGVENFSSEETSAENEMSIIQCAELCENRILLTGDAGRAGLTEAAYYASSINIGPPNIKCFQVPHHGSRRNVSTQLLDFWLGPRLQTKPEPETEAFSAIISASSEDEDHPKKAVIRAMIHRGGRVVTTQINNLLYYHNAPDRGWGPAPPLPYPEDQEQD